MWWSMAVISTTARNSKRTASCTQELVRSDEGLARRPKGKSTSIGANNAEACNAISKADFKSKSYIALKEARESLYWIELLKRNNYIDEKQYQSIYEDCEELVKILVSRCKKLDAELDADK